MKHLKLFFALFAMLALGMGNAWAEEATLDFSALYSADTDVSSTEFKVVDGITLKFAKGSGSTAPKYYSSGSSVRLYAKGTMTISSTIGNITGITLAYGTSDKTNAITTDCGTFSSPNWTGNSSSVIFTIGGTSGHRRIKSVTVTYTPSSGGGEDPTPDPEEPDPTPGMGGDATMTEGTNGTACTVNEKGGIKVGTSSKGGDMKITVPAGATMLHVYAAAWNNVSGLSLNITPNDKVTTTSIALKADAGIANSTPFTLSGNESDYLFDIPLQNITVETTLTFTSSAAKRFVVWGATCETVGGGESEPVIVKTLKSIAVTGMTTTFEQGDVFKFDGTCTATYSVTKNDVAQADETAEVTPTSVSTPNMNTIGKQTVTVTYSEGGVDKTDEYEITITENTVTAGEYCITPNNEFWGTNFNGSLSGEALNQTYTGRQDDITIQYAKGSSQYMYINNSQTRVYGNNSLTFSVPSGYVIKAIAFTADGTNWKGTHTANVGSMTDSKNWVGSANEVTITFGDNCRITKICVTYEELDLTLPSAPTFTPAAGTYNAVQNVTISAEVGTTIYYTLGGTDPTTASNVYASAIEISETTTVKAIAVKDEKVSPVASATYTINLPLTTMDQIFAKATAVGSTATPVHVTMNNWVVTGVKNNNVYVTDGTKGLIIYTASHGFNVGDILSGTVACKVQLYNGSSELTELTNTTEGLTVTTGGTVTPVEVTDITTLGGVNSGSVIKITGPCTVDGTKYYVAGVQLFNSLYTYTNPEDGYNYECTGVYLQYNTTKEILPRKAEDLVKIETQQPAGISFAVTEHTAEVGAAEFAEPTLTNPNSLTVTYKTSDETLATVDATTGEVTIGNKEGKVTITASFAGNEDYVEADASYYITITDPSISEATFVAGTDKSDTKSISKNGITVEFADGSFSRDDNYRCYAGKSMTISYADGNITKIVIECTANDGAEYGPGQFTTETATYSYSGKVGTWTGEANSVTFTNIKQVRMTAITVYYKQDNRADAGLAWNPATVSLTVGDAFTAPTFSNPNSLTVSFESSNTALATVNNAGEISLVSGKTGTATITATFADGDATYKPAEVTCVITVSPKSEKVVILAEYNGQWYALKAAYLSGKTDRLDAVLVNYIGGKLYNVAEADKEAIEWKSIVDGTKVSFLHDGKYLKGKTSTTLLFEAGEDGLYQWDHTNYTMTIEPTIRSFLYNGEAFRNFAVSNAGQTKDGITYSSLPVVTAPEYATGTLYEIKATAENGTIIGAGTYVENTTVTLTANPAMDYTFVNWTKGGEVVSIANPFVFKATENLDLVANFTAISQTSKTLSGKFSTGEYEYAEFATGNLQHNPKSGDWRFAKQQYQYVGEANINVGDDSYEGWIDMLGWSTNDADNNYGVNPNNVNGLYDGTFQDWGDLFSADKNWSTLSADQWKYLLNERTNASSLKQIARVGSVVGIMLFPDNWNAPLTVTAQHDSYFDVDIHNYTLDQWAALENAGALFLPAAGRRAGGHGNTINKDQEEETNPENLNGGHYKHYDNGNIYCYYWTSTINESTKDVSYLHNIQALGGDKYTIGTGAVWGEKGRYGQSVRLAKVTDITPVVIRDGLTVGQWGTLCPTQNVENPEGATFYQIAYLEEKDGLPFNMHFNQITATTLTAGQPYFFIASATEIKGVKFGDVKTEGDNVNGFYGYIGAEAWTLPYQESFDATSDENTFVIWNNSVFRINAETKIKSERCYININSSEPSRTSTPALVGARRITMGVSGINGQNTATGMENVDASAQPVKTIINGQLFILRGEKMYDAQGKLVK